MTVSEADRIKAVERVRADMSPIFGGTPSYKRKRGIYRALKRGDLEITCRYHAVLAQFKMMNELLNRMYSDSNCRTNKIYLTNYGNMNEEIE